MADLQITVSTSGANDVAQNAFFIDDPFGVMMEVTFSNEALDDRAAFDLRLQLVNPGEDPLDGAPWFDPGTKAPRPTIDFAWALDAPNATKVRYVVRWTSYKALMGSVGAGLFPGVFAARASIRSTVRRDSYAHAAFAMTDPFGAKYHYRGAKLK